MKHFLTLFALFLFVTLVKAQTVGINSTGAVPATSAMLDVSSSNKGVLIPRVDIVDLNTAVPVASPVISLLVYNINVSSGVGYYFWDGLKWVKLSDSSSNADEDWYEVGGSLAPNAITDNIFTQGNVGVGATTPDERLHVNGNIALDSYQLGVGSGIFFRDGFNSVTSPYNLSITSDTFDGGSSPDAISINGFEGVSISTGHNTTIQRRLTVVNNGNVGINTITPSQKLDVTGGAIIRSANTSYFWTERVDSDFDMIQSGSSTKRAFSIHPSTSGSDVLAVYANNGAFVPALHVKNTTGNVGVGTLTPAQKLHVVGNIFASGTITSSDIRYKTQVTEIVNSSELIEQLNPVTYYFKKEYVKKGQFDEKLHFGLVAQDVEKLLPNLVYEDNEGYKAVNYIEVISLLIKSNQELQKRLELLEKK